MIPDERNRRSPATRLAAKADYALQAVLGLWRWLYTAAGRPLAPGFVGGLDAVERWLVDRKRA